MLLAPVVRARKGTYLDVFTAAERAGIAECVADGKIVSSARPPRLAKTKEHAIDLVLHRGALRGLDRSVLQRALDFGRGHLAIASEPAGAVLSEERGFFLTAPACGGCRTGNPGARSRRVSVQNT